MSADEKPSARLGFIDELRRRNVFRVAAAYLVSAWLIIQVAETILPAFDYGDETIRNIVIILSIGFIPFLIFSWIFEITPDGLKREVDIATSESIARHTGRKIDRLIIMLLTISVAYFATDKFLMQSSSSIQNVANEPRGLSDRAITASDDDISVAVLPFIDMSLDGEQEYLADGISSDILSLLAKIPELRVISRTSAFSFKGKSFTLNEIAKRLKVNHVLEGTVRLHEERLRITAQLVNANTDTQLWSEIYDREMGNVFEIQDEITASVVAQLAEHLSPPKSEKIDPADYNEFLRARHLLSQYNENSIMSAKRTYEDIVAKSPDYSPAWVGLALSYSALDTLRLMDSTLARRSAMEAAEKALAADPLNSRAHLLMGTILLDLGESVVDVAPYFCKTVHRSLHLSHRVSCLHDPMTKQSRHESCNSKQLLGMDSTFCLQIHYFF